MVFVSLKRLLSTVANLMYLVRTPMTLRNLIAAALVTGTVALGQTDTCRDLKLINGRIVTMDKKNSIVTSVNIHDGFFAGNDAKLSPCAQTINLRGRTVVPGLIDNHNHIVLLGMRPGHDMRLETAASIARSAIGDQGSRGERARRGIHHRHGWLESRAIHGKAPAHAGGTRRGRVQSSRPRSIKASPARRRPTSAAGVFHLQRRRGQPHWRDRRQRSFACGFERAPRRCRHSRIKKRGTVDAMAYAASWA